MDNSLTEIAQVDDNEGQIGQYCLGLPTVLRQILEQSCTKDLVRFSLVNKLWNFEARSVLKERGNLRAYVDRCQFGTGNPCQELAAFVSVLDKMQVVPFSGLHFPICHNGLCKTTPEGSSQTSYKVILERLHFKRLSVHLYDSPERYQNCPARALVKQILEEHCGLLEELILGFGRESEPFFGPIFRNLKLPRLKSLVIESWNFDSDSLTSSFARTLASSSPNLQELQVSSTVDVMLSIWELRPKFAFRPLFKSVADGYVDSIRPEEMEVCVQRDHINMGFLWKFIPKLLEASRATLKTFTMDLLFVLPLMCYGICLENVTKLDIHMNYNRLGELEPGFLELPRGLDFTRVFPKLTEVRILECSELDDDDDMDFSSASDVITVFAEQGAEVLSKALPDRATNIKLLDLERCGVVQDSTLVLLAKMFPDVKTVRTKREHKGASFIDLWEHFLWLEDVIESENVLAY